MVVAIIGLVGFSINRLMTPEQPAVSPSPEASASTPALPPSDESAAGADAAKPVVEADTAPGVSPFRPLPSTPRQTGGTQAAQTAQAQGAAPAPQAYAPSAPALPVPQLMSQDRRRRAEALQMSAASNATLPPLGASTGPMPVAVEPTLTGTMLGSRPTAVFGSDQATVMVPEGGTYMGWRVTRVSHGEVTVWNGSTTLSLRVGASARASALSTAGSPAPSAMTSATRQPPIGPGAANCIIVHYGSRPTPSRQELVYGRIQSSPYDRPDGLDPEVPSEQPPQEAGPAPTEEDPGDPD